MDSLYIIAECADSPTLQLLASLSPQTPRPRRGLRLDTPQPLARALTPSPFLSAHSDRLSSRQAVSGIRQRLTDAKQTNTFWKSRLSLLRREVEKAQFELDHTRARGSAVEIAAVLSESVTAQLELERQRNLHRQAEKREAIRVQTLEHKVAARQAQRKLLTERQQLGTQLRDARKHILHEVQQRRECEVERNAQRRAAVQLEKVHAMVSRVRANAMRREEARLALEANHNAVEQVATDLEMETYHSITETTTLVRRIKHLKEMKAMAEASRGVQKSLNAGLYQDA
jgi:hypothetical protein